MSYPLCYLKTKKLKEFDLRRFLSGPFSLCDADRTRLPMSKTQTRSAALTPIPPATNPFRPLISKIFKDLQR